MRLYLQIKFLSYQTEGDTLRTHKQKLLEIPDVIKKMTVRETNKLVEIMEDCSDKVYEGTDPIEDTIDIYRKTAKKKNEFERKLTRSYQGKNQEKFDPVGDYGPGVQAYFRLLRFLIAIFFVLSVLMVPVMAMYSYGGGYHEVIHTFDSFTKSTL